MGGSPIGAAEVIVAASTGEAIEAFGDGAGVTVVAGGTIVMPDITHRRRAADRVVLIGNAGMSGISSEGGRTVIGAATTLADLSDAVEPLGTCARRVADIEIREQATIGGNLCAPPGVESPRGDLQAALLVLDAQVRSAGAGGERTDPVEDVLASDDATARPRHLRRRARRGGDRDRPASARPRLHRHARLRRPGGRRGPHRRLRGSPARRPAEGLRGRRRRWRRPGHRRSVRSTTSPPPTTRSRLAGTAPRCCRSSSATRSPSSARGARWNSRSTGCGTT